MSKLNLGTLFASSPVSSTIQSLGSVSGAITVDVSAGAFIEATANGAGAWVFSVADPQQAQTAMVWYLLITNGSTTQTFQVAVDGYANTPVKWPSGSAPSLQPSGSDLLCFIKGSGNTVIGYRVAANVSVS